MQTPQPQQSTALFSGSKLRERREAAGITQTVLGAKITVLRNRRTTVMRQQVEQWESGKAVPGFDMALAIAAALGCDVNDLSEETAIE